jgi:hypothetical protein
MNLNVTARTHKFSTRHLRMAENTQMHFFDRDSSRAKPDTSRLLANMMKEMDGEDDDDNDGALGAKPTTAGFFFFAGPPDAG